MMERCDNGWIFWPSEGKCFQLYTQGPCHKVRERVNDNVNMRAYHIVGLLSLSRSKLY